MTTAGTEAAPHNEAREARSAERFILGFPRKKNSS